MSQSSPVDFWDLEPCDLGLPEKFATFRDIQREAMHQALYGKSRFQGLCVPTGGGKSLAAVATALASGRRTVILTATKGLADQYMADFGDSGLVDIRGRANYECQGLMNINCRFGALEGCRVPKIACEYEIAATRACHSNLTITNYAYWIRRNIQAPLARVEDYEVINPVELLILDEAHAAPSQLSNALQVRVREEWLKEAGYQPKEFAFDSLPQWIKRVKDNILDLECKFKIAEVELKHAPEHKKARARLRATHLQDLFEAFKAITEMDELRWLCEYSEGTPKGRDWRFDCIWPGNWAEKRLFLKVPRVVLLSATLRPITLRMLGLQQNRYEYKEWPRVFAADRSPNIHVKTVRLNRDTEKDPVILRKWVDTVDTILEGRPDRKGIIHTVSYSRQKYLMEHSRFASRFMGNTSDPESERAAEVVEAFRRSKDFPVLISPSFSTGWDFPGDQCRFQILAKMPWPDISSKIVQARNKVNPMYINALVMQEIVQATGRGMRFEDDWCENFIIDDGIVFFMSQNRSLAPVGFNFRQVSTVPLAFDPAAC